jgi:hypothetical protein
VVPKLKIISHCDAEFLVGRSGDGGHAPWNVNALLSSAVFLKSGTPFPNLFAQRLIFSLVLQMRLFSQTRARAIIRPSIGVQR